MQIDPIYAKKLAHDLKAPLSALKVLLENIEDKDQKELLEQSILRYEKLIEEIQNQII